MNIITSPNHRYLMREDGSPFFLLADTAWELFHRLAFEEADFYLQTRASQGFNVILAVALDETDGLGTPNANGHAALHGLDPTQPNEDYFRHIDRVVRRANELGLVVAMLPTWGDKWNKAWGKGPEIFTPENSRAYCKWLARRYCAADLIWVLGGDRPVENDTHRAVIAAMAEGLREGDGGAHPITFHPCGGQRSSQHFHNAPWLDFNMSQTGHNRNSPNYEFIAADHALTPVKPALDGEPGYEAHFAGFNIANGFLTDFDARRAAWWAVLSGACGHAYGCHPVWQFYDERHDPVNLPMLAWREALKLPGARQMRHVKEFIESLPYFTRRPAPELILNNTRTAHDRMVASTDATPGKSDGTYVIAYTTHSFIPVTLDLAVLKDAPLLATWCDPQTGMRQKPFTVGRKSTETFHPPVRVSALDWVLLVQTQ